MKTNMRMSTIALGAFLLAGTGTASAYPYSVDVACAPFLNAVGEKITTAFIQGQFLGKNAFADQRNLIFKLDAASAKLVQNPPKYGDAIVKLEDIAQTSYALSSADKPKLDGTAASAIIDAAGSAITQCLAAYLK